MSKLTEKEIIDTAFNETQELMQKVADIFDDYLNSEKSKLSTAKKILIVSRASNGLIAISHNTIVQVMKEQELFIMNNCKQN